ncbi:SIS domain-containing protein [soil metagenome]
MNSIDTLKLDFNSQIKELNKIHNHKILDDCIYIGSGDSYVAGLIAEYLTHHKCKCYSPSDLLNSKFLTDKTYCFISVTGRTKANIKLARIATESGVKTIAITLDRNSKLAEACKKVVPLKITKINTPTAGFSTFVANAVTCLQIAGIDVPMKFDTWYNKGIELSLNFIKSTILPNATVYVLGNNTLYALALYASFQMAEFFGSTAIAHKLEEFCHSPIFGLKKSHHVWVLGQNEKQVSQRLSRLGLNLTYFELQNKDIFSQVFQSIFFVQSLILLLAEKRGNTELQFVTMKDILKASSDIIYDK